MRGCYRALHPDWTVRVVEPPAGPWVKAAAVMPVVATTAADIVVVADADVWCDGIQLAVDQVAEHGGWARPGKAVHRLTEDATRDLVERDDLNIWGLVERPYRGVDGGGIVVARRETLLDVPMDPRFEGWGQEDRAWGVALYNLAPQHWFGKAPLIHLWHPLPQRMDREYGNPQGRALWERYVAAAERPQLLRELLGEARVALDALDPALHAHPSHR